MDWRRKAQAFWKFIWRNLDVLLIMAVAIVALVVEVLGSPKRELIDSVLLALLGATSFALLRDREHRIDLGELRQLASDAMNDRPYEVVSQVNEWDIQDRTNSVMTATQHLRFTRNDVSTMHHFSRGDGKIERSSARWRRPGAQWIPAHQIHEFTVRGGKKMVYSFDEEHRRGDMLDWCVQRFGVERFPNTHEVVEISARTKSDHPRVMKVVWPTDDAPSHIEIRLNGKPARTLLPKYKNRRACVEEKISGLKVGEAVEIGWTW